MPRHHLTDRSPCPHLPGVARVWTAADMAPFRGRYDAAFYEAALQFAQSLWLEGKPAQSLLQMNKALMSDLPGSANELAWPLPYAAKGWVMRHAPKEEFLGDPVRHYQHLASRMSGPRTELRSWRAWACLHLAEAILPAGPFSRDTVQIEREALRVPEVAEVAAALREDGLPGEDRLLESVLQRERAAGQRGY